MRKHLIIVFLLFIVIKPGAAQEPTLQWQATNLGDGILTSPLPLDMYYAPQYPSSSYEGQETFFVSFTEAGSRAYGLKPTGTNAIPIGYVNMGGEIARSTPSGWQFVDNQPPQVVFGSEPGVYVLRHNASLELIPTDARVSSAPVLANLDNDVDMEIVALTDAGMLHVWNWDGETASSLPNFPIQLDSEASLMSPAVANLNSESRNEIVITTSSETQGSVYVYNYLGTMLSGWPVTYNDPITTSAAIGKLDSFGDESRNVVIATESGMVNVLRFDASGIIGWPRMMGAAAETSPVLVDLDLDGDLEVIVCAADSTVHAWHHNGQYVNGWPVDLSQIMTARAAKSQPERQRTLTVFCDPVVVDVDSDNQLEVIVPVIDNALFIALNHDGSQLQNGWPIAAGLQSSQNVFTSPSVKDIDNDGYLEMTIATFADFGAGNSAKVYCYQLGLDPGSDLLKPWPMARQNIRRTGSALILGQGIPPFCNFPDPFVIPPGSTVEFDFSDYVVDVDSATPTWTCQLNGVQQISLTQTNNHTFSLDNSTGWIGLETVTAQVIDPGGLVCGGSFQIIGGLKGDVNADGTRSPEDATSLAVFLLGGTLDSYQSWAADVDENGILTIFDLFRLIDMLLF